jgi:hypothetical protein
LAAAGESWGDPSNSPPLILGFERTDDGNYVIGPRALRLDLGRWVRKPACGCSALVLQPRGPRLRSDRGCWKRTQRLRTERKFVMRRDAAYPGGVLLCRQPFLVPALAAGGGRFRCCGERRGWSELLKTRRDNMGCEGAGKGSHPKVRVGGRDLPLRPLRRRLPPPRAQAFFGSGEPAISPVSPFRIQG